LVADGHGDGAEHVPDAPVGLLRVVPEHRSVVEVEHDVSGAAASLKEGMVRGAARLLRQACHAEPEQSGAAERLKIQVLRAQAHVGSGRRPVEPQWEVVRREDLAERDGGVQVVHDDHVAVVHSEVAHRPPDVQPEGVVADARDDRRAMTEPRGGHSDVGRAAAEELAEGLDLLQPDAGLQGVHVDARAADRQDVEGRS
jgi:hypothetical protein